MRIKLLFLAIVPFILLNSCKKVEEAVDELTKFDVSFEEELTLPAIGLTFSDPILLSDYQDVFGFELPSIETDIEDELAQYNTSKDLFEEVWLKEASFKVLLPVGEDFSFLKSIKIYLAHEADGTGSVMIASKDPVSDSVGNILILDVVNQDLVEFLLDDEIFMDIEIATDEPIAEEMNLQINVVFEVNAKVLGI